MKKLLFIAALSTLCLSMSATTHMYVRTHDGGSYKYSLEEVKDVVFFEDGDYVMDVTDSNIELKFRIISDSTVEVAAPPSSYNPYVVTSCAIPDKVRIDGKEYTVTGIGKGAFDGCENLRNIELPSTITNIGAFAFAGCEKLGGISFPDNLSVIGDSAFFGCSTLSYVDFPSSLSSIGDCAFSECHGLSDIRIPSNVKNIGIAPFSYCCRLKAIVVDPENPNFKSLDDILYDKDFTTLINAPAGIEKEDISVPSSVTKIGDAAFLGCHKILSVEIPSGVTTIGRYAFGECISLTEINIPSSVSSIGGSAFWWCRNLRSIEIPSGVTTIESWTFVGCSSLVEVKLPSSVTSIAESFSGCRSLKSINIPSGVTAIAPYTFMDCSSLESLTLSSNVTSIGQSAFCRCNNLELIIDNNKENVKIENNALEDCKSVTYLK